MYRLRKKAYIDNLRQSMILCAYKNVESGKMKYIRYIIAAVIICLLSIGIIVLIKSNSALSGQLSDIRTQLTSIQEQVSNIPTPSPPPSPTPATTPIPTASPIPVSYTITTGGIVQALIETGLPIARFETYDENTDPNDLIGRPHAYIDKTNFFDKRIGSDEYADCGMIEIFSNHEDAYARYLYIENIIMSGLTKTQYQLLYDNILLRFDNDFKPSQVDEYDIAMKTILGIGD